MEKRIKDSDYDCPIGWTTDFGTKLQELYKMTNKELYILVATSCGLHYSALTKDQLRRTKKELIKTYMQYSITRRAYDGNGMLIS